MGRKLTLSTKIISLGIAITFCFSLSLAWVYTKYRASHYDVKTRELSQLTDVTYTLVAEYNERAAKGEFSMDEAKKRAMSRLKALRYNKDDYFWISDLGARVLMHPLKPEMDGKDQSDYKDPSGKRIFVEMAAVCQEKGAGLVEYLWSKPGEAKPSPKISYVKLYKPWGWVIGTGIYFDELAALTRVSYIILGIIILVTAGALFLSYCMARSISRPINHIIEGLTDGAEQVASASSQVSSASQTLAEGASEQAAGLQETSASMEEMTSMTRQNAENARSTNEAAVMGSNLMKQARESMKALVQSIEEIAKASEETGKIIKTIDEIAFQTNLLALNAAVEAARAGEAGAGFAVVADEVRNLAMRAAEAAKTTSRLIEGTIKKVKEGSEVVRHTDDSYRQVALALKKVVDLVGEITAASQEQALGIEQINKAVAEMDKVVQQNAASAEESASAAEEMNSQAQQMKGFVGELVNLVSASNGNGARSAKAYHSGGYEGNASAASRQSDVTMRKSFGTPAKKVNDTAFRPGAYRRQNEPRADQVIPLEDPDFREF
jgi:methyl-accepting chemotaxis protein